MRVILDSNIIIDVIEKRNPFFEKSCSVIQLSMNKRIDAFVCAGCMTDIHYIISRNVGKRKAKAAMLHLAELVGVCDTLAVDTVAAHALDMDDFEDSVLAATAKREKADYIVTRNKKDFISSPIPAVEPEELLALCASAKGLGD
ncbi:MAG: PIN domain-containing protein [Oscillospiraceae bacterium]|nr:PIN domain-containing protein [Oscillospiraceae bacterium]